MATPYTSHAELEARFGAQELLGLTSGESEPPAVDVAQVERAIADTQGEVDAYLRGRYRLPFTTAVPELTRVASDIARYRLYSGRPTDEVRERYKEAVAHLRRLSSGEAQLPLDVNDAPVRPGLPEVSTPGRQFTRETLERF